MNNNWTVNALFNPPFGLAIYLYRLTKGNKAECLYFENGEQKYSEFDAITTHTGIEGFRPLFSVPYSLELECDFSKKLLQALVDRGIQLPDKNFAQGKLEAAEKHLEDMRRLVFEEPK